MGGNDDSELERLHTPTERTTVRVLNINASDRVQLRRELQDDPPMQPTRRYASCVYNIKMLIAASRHIVLSLRCL